MCRRIRSTARFWFLAADDLPWELLMTTGLIYAPAAGRNLLRVPPLNGVGTDRQRGEELTLRTLCASRAL